MKRWIINNFHRSFYNPLADCVFPLLFIRAEQLRKFVSFFTRQPLCGAILNNETWELESDIPYVPLND